MNSVEAYASQMFSVQYSCASSLLLLFLKWLSMLNWHVISLDYLNNTEKTLNSNPWLYISGRDNRACVVFPETSRLKACQEFNILLTYSDLWTVAQSQIQTEQQHSRGINFRATGLRDAHRSD